MAESLVLVISIGAASFSFTCDCTANIGETDLAAGYAMFKSLYDESLNCATEAYTQFRVSFHLAIAI